MSSPEFFKNKVPKYRKKSFFGFFILAILVLTPLSIYFFINPPYSLSPIPNIYIDCEDDIHKDDYVNCMFNLENDNVKSRIKVRGHFNAEQSKKGYRIELSEKESLLGMRRDDDWILFAMYMDYTKMRTKLSFDLWRSLHKDNPTAILPESRYVNLFINGKFQGLYLFAEKNDKKLFGLDQAQKDIESSLIFQSRKHHKNFQECLLDYWDQSWPNEDEGIYIKDEILEELISFVDDEPDDIFFNDSIGIFNKFDKDNLIDFFIFNFFSFHQDFWSKNYFLLRDTAPSEFFLIPWDFDNSFGQRTWEFYDVDENPEEEIRYRNQLFDRLLDNDDFKEDCKDRWKELREDLWTKDFILEMIFDMHEEIKDSLEADVRRWTPDIDLDEYIDHLFEWIPERLEFCDEYFEEF